MKIIKRLSRLGLACLLSIASLLIIAVPEAHATPINCTWAYSGGSNNNFNNSGNWQNCNGGAPTGGGNEELVFPVKSGVVPSANDNLSLPGGGSFLDITFTTDNTSNQGYVITGNAISVGNITDQSSTTNGNELALDINLSGSSQVNFTGSSSSRLVIGDSNNPGTHTLDMGNTTTLQLADTTIDSNLLGNGTINTTSSDGGGVKLMTPSSSFNGTINATGSTLSLDNFDGSIPITVASGSTLNGDNSSTDSITVNSGGIIAPGHSPGCLSAGSQLVVHGTYQAEIAGTTACSGYDQITSGGSIDVTGATLNVSLLNSFTPSVGNSFTIIKNNGGSAITGTFAGLPEGGTLTVGQFTFTITYQGNGENDVVLTLVSTAAAASAPKAPDTGLALIAARPGTVLAVTLLTTSTLIFLARRLKPLK